MRKELVIVVCDRCGKEIDSRLNNYSREFNRHVKLAFHEPSWDTIRYVDLCKVCMLELINWFVKGGGEV